MSMPDIIEQAAKAMFESVHGYHVDLNWDNAHQAHKDLYVKLAKIVKPIFHDYYTTGDYTVDVWQEIGFDSQTPFFSETDEPEWTI